MQTLCVLSDERAHKSKSPMMHNAVIHGRELENEYLYTAFEIKEGKIQDAIESLRTLNILGANVTVPYKEQVIPFLDSLSEDAATAGAVNTIHNVDGKLHGHNTDIDGFLNALKLKGADPSGKTALLAGTGGAARGLLVALKKGGCEEIYLAGRSEDKLQALSSEFGVKPIFLNVLKDNLINPEIIVNSTAVSSKEESPELAETIASFTPSNVQAIMDINYGRENNIWQGLASRTNAAFSDGFTMLALQARLSFKIWTGLPVTDDEFLKALLPDLSL